MDIKMRRRRRTDSPSGVLVATTISAVISILPGCRGERECWEDGTCPLVRNDAGADAEPDALDGRPGGPFTFEGVPLQKVTLDGASEVLLKVQRAPTQKSAIRVSVSDLPDGVTAEPLVISGSNDEGRLVLRASGIAKVGRYEAVVAGQASDNSASAKLPLLVAGKPGTVDTTFGAEGRRVVMNAGSLDAPEAILVGRNDEIFVVGECSVGGAEVTCAARASADGTLDSRFGGTASGAPVQIRNPAAVMLDSAGRIVVGGESGTIGRFTADGKPDASFGIVYVGSSANEFNPLGGVYALASCPDDTFVAGFSAGRYVGLHKLTSTGKSVASFGASGFKAYTWEYRSVAAGVVCLPNGYIRLAGDWRNEQRTTTGVGIAQFTPTGGLDPAFGMKGGYQTFPYVADYSLGALSLPDGRFLLGMVRGEASGVAMISATGNTLDASFGTDGVVMLPAGTGRVHGLARQPDGRFLIAVRGEGTDRLVRLNAIGAVDSTFGGTGDVRVAPFPGSSSAHVAVQSDGRILLVSSNDEGAYYVTRFWN